MAVFALIVFFAQASFFATFAALFLFDAWRRGARGEVKCWVMILTGFVWLDYNIFTTYLT